MNIEHNYLNQIIKIIADFKLFIILMPTNGRLNKQELAFQNHKEPWVNPEFEASYLCDVECSLNIVSLSFLDSKREL